MLEALGLAPTAETIYRTVLEHPDWGVAELAAQLGWPELKVRAALDELADLYLVRRRADNPNLVSPVDPRLALGSLLSRSEAELKRRTRQIEATRTAVATLAAQYSTDQAAFAEVIERIEGLDNVRRRLEDLAEHAQHECLSFAPGGAQEPDTLEASKPLNTRALNRGVVIRTLYQDSFRNDANTVRYVRWLTSLGGQARTVASLPLQMVVVDRETVLLPLNPDDSRRGAIEVRSISAVTAMVALFEQVWSVGTDWGDAPVRDSRGLSAQEQELLRLLANGDTDELASRKLGVSLRTVRRMASDLMAHLKARSRFDAGVRAAKRGWV
ncbi:LuxR C-terminal-related transcriptional regulator [Kutzneria sp. NPDC052558]|uniref:LuxR C-terminal-related transcriptional regulator n=1 Tax=Kutzneria sp. NPDC052558 TaxID=3364121 RepID=UPI0037CA70DB